MNYYPEMFMVNPTRYDAVHGFALVPEVNCALPVYLETDMGPWGWQWRDGVRDLVSAPPLLTWITIEVLMGHIEKDAPGICRTIKDLGYSRSPECPFIINELLMTGIRRRLHKYEEEKALLSPGAQIGVRKSIAAALGGRKGPTMEAGIHAVAYPYSVDLERIVDDLCGPRRWLGTSSVDGVDNGSCTMSMDLEIEEDTISTPSELSTRSKAVGSRIYKETMDLGGVDGSPGRNL